ncbi:hypothetical protein E2C01_042528 [Portunus trituberculatus]|uniref:Uncharacterized protein n=1 Tax=Portunus trituberculatus TaxID=210409 RepID=A0A5B7FTV8_PORTR|nr:hypothetical protein [Portunus trituberculatus]
MKERGRRIREEVKEEGEERRRECGSAGDTTPHYLLSLPSTTLENSGCPFPAAPRRSGQPDGGAGESGGSEAETTSYLTTLFPQDPSGLFTSHPRHLLFVFHSSKLSSPPPFPPASSPPIPPSKPCP